MSDRILLISGNFHPEPTGIGKYSGEMIDWLASNGYDCTVITTYPYYPDWKVQEKYKKSRFWFKKEVVTTSKTRSNAVTIIRCPHYVPTSPTGIKRLLSEFTIWFSSYLVVMYLLFTRKFNYVITVAPPFELGLFGILYKKIKGAVFIYHVQDLQIDAARELGMIKSTSVLRCLFSLEKFILNHADYICTISEGMSRKIKSKCNKEIILFPNWVDTNLFFPIPDKTKLKEQYGFKSTDKVILYSGAIGEKQGLKSIVHLAKYFDGKENIKFVICGSGPYKGHLINLKNTLVLNNLIFMPLQPFDKLNLFLNMADFHLILQKSNASDLVMPSKLSTILAIGGVAIVTANPGTSLYDIICSANMGILLRPEDQEALQEAVEFALSLDPSTMPFNARTYAEENISIDQVLSKFANNILTKGPKVARMGIKNKEVVMSR